MSQPYTAERRQDLAAETATTIWSNVEIRQDLPQGAITDEEVRRLEKALQRLQVFWAD
jgi:hypothetical protein